MHRITTLIFLLCLILPMMAVGHYAVNIDRKTAEAMLAAYNGGAGNTQKWTAVSNNDPDLLYEVIRFEETRNYLHNIC